MNAATRQTVLVVDDAPQNIKLMAELLRDQYAVQVANGGERALKLATSDNPPDLILLDVMMPEMDGYEVMRRLKASESTRDIPVIFLTAKQEVDDETLGMELGAVDYLTKPISPALTLARIKTHLFVQRAKAMLQDQDAAVEARVAARLRELQSGTA